MLGLGIQGEKGEKGEKGAGVYICKLSEFMNSVTLSTDGKIFIFNDNNESVIGVPDKRYNSRFDEQVLKKYSDVQKLGQQLMLNYNDVNLEDEDAIIRDISYDMHLQNLLYTYNNDENWYSDTSIFESNGYIKDNINQNDNTIIDDASYYVKIPALKNIITYIDGQEHTEYVSKNNIDQFIRDTDFTNGNVMGIAFSYDEEVKYTYIITDPAEVTSKFNSGDYDNPNVEVLNTIFNEAIDSSQKETQKQYIKEVHANAVQQIHEQQGDDNKGNYEIGYIENINTNRYRGIKNYFKNGDIIYFSDTNDDSSESEMNDIKYMIVVSDDIRNKTAKELENLSFTLYPFKIKYINYIDSEKDKTLLSNYKISIINNENYFKNNIKNHKNVALSNLISSENAFNIANIISNNTNISQYIKLSAIENNINANQDLNVYTNNSNTYISANTNRSISINNVYVQNTFDNKAELYSPLYDKNLILCEEFIKPITDINLYLCNDSVLLGCELNLQDYIYNTTYYNDYSYGYEIYDSNHSLIQCEQTSNEKLQMFINMSILEGASNVTTKELNIPLYISLNDGNNITSSWSNKTYKYYSNIMIGDIEYALYIDDSQSISIYNESAYSELVKILMPVVQHKRINNEIIVDDSSINHELYTFACMETIKDKRQHIYVEGNNLKYTNIVDDDTEKLEISINPEASKNYLTKLSKCYAYTRKIDINDIAHKLSVLEIPYYINSFIVCKNTGMKLYSKTTKIICTVDLKQNILKEYSIEVLERSAIKKYNDDILYEITPITNEKCSATLSITPQYDCIIINEIKFGYDNTNVYSKTLDSSNGSWIYSLDFESNLPSYDKNLNHYDVLEGDNGYIGEINTSAYNSYENYINEEKPLPYTLNRNISVYVKYHYKNSFIPHYTHFNLVQPGYVDNRYIPNIKLYIETNPNELEKLNSDNSKNFKTYLKVSIDNLFETWRMSVLHPENLKFKIQLSALDTDLDYNIITSSDPKRSNIRPYLNVDASLYNLYVDSSIITLYNSTNEYNECQDNGYYIHEFNINEEFSFTDKYENIHPIIFEFKENPLLTNLFLQFYVSAFSVTYNDKIIAEFDEKSYAIYQQRDKYNKTYTYISNKLDVTFNPIDYILCPNEYYKNEQHYLSVSRTAKHMKYGSESQLVTGIMFHDASIYNNDIFNRDFNSDLVANNDKQLYTWKNAKVKLGYFQDNIESINITNTDSKKSMQKIKTQYAQSKNQKHVGNIAITYNNIVMNPIRTINQYSFIYNDKTYSSSKYNQYVDGSLYINHEHMMKLRSNELLQSMNEWNADYSYVNSDNVCPGKLSKYGNGYMFMNDQKNKAYYAKIIGKFSYDLMTLDEVKKLNDMYVYEKQSFNELKYIPININKEPDSKALFRSFVYNVAWENQDNKVINNSSYYEHFTLYPRILYNYDFGTLNVLTLCKPCILDSSIYSFEQNGRWF